MTEDKTAPAEATEIATKEKSMAERFTEKVAQQFGASTGGEIQLTAFQQNLAKHYFIAVDQALRKAEEARQRKTTNKDPVPVTWANTNMEQLALDVVAMARIGLDPAQSNHINMIPYKNNKTGKYDIGMLEGYRGMELKAKKYGLTVPDDVVVELVHENDDFTPLKRGADRQYDTYSLDIKQPFNRGRVVGGFYYHVFANAPEKNKLVLMSIEEIEKRKPKYASAEFWGGTKPIYKNNRKTNEVETIAGWYEQMCLKTVIRAAYRDITIDSQKIDDSYQRLAAMEDAITEASITEVIESEANQGELIGEPEPVAALEAGEPQEEPEASADNPEGWVVPEEGAPADDEPEF